MVQERRLMKKSKHYWFVWVILFSILLSACGVGSNPTSVPPTVIAPASETPIPLPTATEIPTQVPTIIPTATPVLHPLQIEAMRAREYPGSDIVIEDTLDPGVNY